jgi:hypothetical protein
MRVSNPSVAVTEQVVAVALPVELWSTPTRHAMANVTVRSLRDLPTRSCMVPPRDGPAVPSRAAVRQTPQRRGLPALIVRVLGSA